jgi:hypothetical protein
MKNRNQAQQPQYTTDRQKYGPCDYCEQSNVFDIDGNFDFLRIGDNVEEHSCWLAAWMDYCDEEGRENMLLITTDAQK